MRLGVSPFASSRTAAVELVEAATSGGLDTIWLGDGIFANADFPDWRGGMETMTSLAWWAGRFPEARIGVTAAVLPLRDIDWLAREANTLAHLTEGRFVLAVAAGFWPEELTYRGVEPTERGRVFRERLAELREKLVSGPLSPGPYAGEPPPVWLAGAVATMRHALELGLPFQASRLTPDELEPVARAWHEGGGGMLAHRVYVEVGDMPEGDRVERHAVSGSAAQLTEALGRFAEQGVADLSMVVGHDDESALRTVEVLATEVAPQLD